MNWLLLALLWGGDPQQMVAGFDARERQLLGTLSPLGRPPPDATNRWADDPLAARFGETLFFDRRLSADGRMACATCHVPALGFSDALPLARGAVVLPRHTQSLWNVAWQPWLFWDGRADSLWAQALVPLEHPDEMAFSRPALLELLHSEGDLNAAYEAVFGLLPAATMATGEELDRVLVNVGKALAAFERRLISPPAPFDHFVEALRSGADSHPGSAALATAARRGLKLFLGRARCVLCHSGPAFSDGQFHNTLVAQVRDDAGRRAAIGPLLADPFNAAGNFSDDRLGWRAQRLQGVEYGAPGHARFRTPGLRNVALTAPYMHGGQFTTLSEVIEHYSALHGADSHGHQGSALLVPLHLTVAEKSALVAFLESLTGLPDEGSWLQTVLRRSAQ